MANPLELLVEAHRRGLRGDQMRFRAGGDVIQIEDVVLRHGDDVVKALRLLNLRKGRAETLTRRIHLLFCALAAARVHRSDGWMSVDEIGQLEGWSGSGSVAKLLINEFELGTGALGIIEQKGRGADAKLRLRMPAKLIDLGELPAGVSRLFAQEPRLPPAPPADVQPRSVRQWDLAVDLAEALRTACAGRTLLLRPLYQGGGREVGNHSLVFGGVELRPLGATQGRPAATSVLVKLPIGLGAGKVLTVHQDALDAEIRLLAERAGWPGLPARVERIDVVLGVAAIERLQHAHGVQPRDAALALQALVVPLGHPATAGAEPRLLRAVIDAAAGSPRRLTRRDIHNVLLLAARLATLTRLLHRERRAHRHLSVDAITLRYELGIIEDLVAADLAASVEVPEDADELLFHDLFDLGRVLTHMITGWRVSEADFEPPFPGRDNIRKAVEGEGETVARLLFAICRYLLEASPGDAAAGGEPASVGLLDQFLHEIQHIDMLHWSRARGVPERRVTAGGSSDALPSDVPRKDWPRSAADPVAIRLVTISHLVDLLSLQHWCERYVTSVAWHDSMPGPGKVVADAAEAVPSARRSIAILQRGFGRSAAREMWTYLWRADRDEPVENLVRVVRNYAIHWAREQRADVAHDLDDGPGPRSRSRGLRDELARLAIKFEARAEPDRARLAAWLDELARRIDGRAPDAPDGGEPPNKPTDDRLWSWMRADALQRLLRTPTPPTEKDIYEVEIALRGRSSPETVFWHILLARAWLSAAAHGLQSEGSDTESGWDKAMRTLLVAAGVAASRKLPAEMAATLAASAYLTRIALTTAELRKQVVSQGADEDGVRVQAAECALTASDAYLWLDNQHRHCRSVLEAARLLAGCAFPERVVQAFQLLALARNHRLLDWQPPLLSDADPRDRAGHGRFERYEPEAVSAALEAAGRGAETGVEPGPRRFTELEQAVFDEAHRTWARLRRRRDADDPGTAMVPNYFARHAPTLDSVIEAAAPAIEIAGGGLLALARRHHGEPAVARIVDFGCGPGDEARRLADTGRYEVWGIDAPAWFAVAPAAGAADAPRATDEQRSRGPRWLAIEPVEYAEQILRGARPDDHPAQVDVVVFRCALGRVARRDLLLAAAHALLRPGGLVVAVDWIQTRTTDRITWSRLLNTVRFVDIETRLGYQRLTEQTGFTGFQAWDWRDVAEAVPGQGAGVPSTSAAVEDLQMHRWFQRRFEAIRQALDDERRDAGRSPHDRAFLMRASRDLEVLTAMTQPRGVLDWLYWAARRPRSPVTP